MDGTDAVRRASAIRGGRHTMTPTLQLLRTTDHGKPAFEMVIRGACADSLCQQLDAIGLTPTTDITNRRAIVCTTADDLSRVQNALKALVAVGLIAVAR